METWIELNSNPSATGVRTFKYIGRCNEGKRRKGSERAKDKLREAKAHNRNTYILKHITPYNS